MVIECRLKIILIEKGISQRTFSKQVGISETALSLLVRGKSLPTLEVAYRISDALGLNIEDIWVKK